MNHARKTAAAHAALLPDADRCFVTDGVKVADPRRLSREQREGVRRAARYVHQTLLADIDRFGARAVTEVPK